MTRARTRMFRDDARVFVTCLLFGMVPASLICLPSVAHAAAGDDNLSAGLQKFDAGRKAYDAGQFEEALGHFKSSLELLASPNTRLYIGRCYRALGKVASAFTALKLAAREAQDRQAASGEKRYAATRDTANQEAAELEAKVPRLTVAVPANPPPGFSVKVDGHELPQAAWGLASETDPGTIVVEATGPRLVPFKKTITLAEGAKERIDIPMTRVPTATLAVKLKNLPSGVALTLDGQAISGVGIDAPRDLDVGDHALVVSAPGYVTFRWNKALADGDKEVVEVTLAADPRAGGGAGTPKWLFFTVAGGALVAAGTGTVIGLHATSQQSGQVALDPTSRDPSVKSSIQSQAIVADILFIGAGVLGIGAGILFFTTHWKTEKTETTSDAPVSFAPWFGPTSGGIGARGSF